MMILDDTAIRAALHTDVQSAWSPVRIYDDRPELPTGPKQLPYALIQLQSQLIPTRNAGGTSRTSTITEVSIPHVYTLTLVAAWPVSPTSILTAKLASVQAILNILTAGTRYAGHIRDVTGINLFPAPIDENEPVYSVEVEFTVEVTTGA